MYADDEIVIEYAAVENEIGKSGGFLPALWVNGKRRGDTWSKYGYSKDEALAAALADAKSEAARFVGDWNITVRQRTEAK